MHISSIRHKLFAATFGLFLSSFGVAQEHPGATVFRNICAACHGEEGLGMPGLYPPLQGSHLVEGDPAITIRIVLHGLQGPVTVAGQEYNNIMPPNVDILGDEEIAAVLNFVRGRWGAPDAEEIPVAKVTEIRNQYADRTTMWTIAELEALPPSAPPPSAAVAAPPAAAQTKPALRPAVPETAPDPLPWFRLTLLAFPVAVFLVGVCLLPDRGK